MKYALVICLLSACIIDLASCDCGDDCDNRFKIAVSGSKNPSIVCPAATVWINCYENICMENISQFVPWIKQLLQERGVTCNNLPGSSTVLAGSLVTVLAGLMVAVRRFFIN